MFGTVTAGMIADQIKHQFDISLDKRKIHLEHPIRALGDHEVELRLHAEVKGTLKVRVESTTPIITPAPAEPKREEGREPRREKRGKHVEDETVAKPEAAEARPKVEKPAKVEKAPKAPKAAKAERKEKKAE